MTTTTTTLASFLLARIAEDEEVARAATDEPVFAGLRLFPDGYGGDVVGASRARVLAECEAKRRIVEAHSAAWEAPWTDDSVQRRYAARGRTAGLYDALRALAMPYADHPDYREEWRP